MEPRDKRNPKPSPLVCLCNAVPRADVETAIGRGAKTLSQVFDRTLAGVGPCGGSCQPELRKMLEQYLADGTFPSPPPRKTRGR